jgi:2-polyprenyl-6-methoxyphenol hydroxylase-like FAD-dependent oxidoreductase
VNTKRTAIVIGAGIGGLACGVALRRAGWTVRIYERTESPRALGFGLGLAPNALAALRELDVADRVVRAGSMINRVELRRSDGRVLRRFGVPVGLPALVALRSDLHGALLAAVGDDTVQLGCEAVSFFERGSDVTVQFKDGSSDTGSLLIGADGIHSAIRRCLHPNEHPARASRFCALRGVAYGVSDYLGDFSGVGYLDEGIEAATIRASVDAVYWYMSLRVRDVPEPTPQAILKEWQPEFEPAFQAIVSATKPDDMRFDRLWERDPLYEWGRPRITLLGDAAHPLLPHTGQGAAQALEDAVALGLAVAGFDDVEIALRQYEAVRSHRTRSLVRLGPRIARVTTTRSLAVNIMRSMAIRLIPERWFARLANGVQQDPHEKLRKRHAA